MCLRVCVCVRERERERKSYEHLCKQGHVACGLVRGVSCSSKSRGRTLETGHSASDWQLLLGMHTNLKRIAATAAPSLSHSSCPGLPDGSPEPQAAGKTRRSETSQSPCLPKQQSHALESQFTLLRRPNQRLTAPEVHSSFRHDPLGSGPMVIAGLMRPPEMGPAA